MFVVIVDIHQTDRYTSNYVKFQQSDYDRSRKTAWCQKTNKRTDSRALIIGFRFYSLVAELK